MTIKYSAILIPNIPFFPKITTQIALSANVELFRGNIADIVNSENVSHWEEWLGKLSWEGFNEKMNFLISHSDSLSYEELDNLVFHAYDLLLLVAPFLPPISQPYSINGECEENGKDLKTIQSFSRLSIWCKSFWGEQCKDEVIKWENSYCSNPARIDEWKTYIDYFENDVVNNTYPYLVESYRSFRQAFYSNHLEFKIPNHVRSIESLIALGRGKKVGGWENFVKRTKLAIANMPQVPIINFHDEFIEKDLKELYFVRNDCSHGKLITDSLESIEEYKSGVTPGHMALMEMLAESSARYILQQTLIGKNKIKPLCTSRADLEDAWKKGNLP